MYACVYICSENPRDMDGMGWNPSEFVPHVKVRVRIRVSVRVRVSVSVRVRVRVREVVS